MSNITILEALRRSALSCKNYADRLASTIPTRTSQLSNDSNFATESYVTTKVSEATKGALVYKQISWSTLYLSTDKYQTVDMISGTTIKLPSTTEFVEIHLFFSATYNMTLTMPSCRWQGGAAPTIENNKTYELIFTRLPGEWLGGCVVYE